MSETRPVASRPLMQGYGIAAADAGEGLLPWAWANERLRASHNYWISTLADSGAPHTMPVWGVWYGGGVVFSSGVLSRKVRNLLREPRCTVTTESAAEAVIVEGIARRVVDAVDIESITAAYVTKYDGGFPPDSALLRIVPHTVFGFIEREGQFTTTATRWRFPRG